MPPPRENGTKGAGGSCIGTPKAFRHESWEVDSSVQGTAGGVADSPLATHNEDRGEVYLVQSLHLFTGFEVMSWSMRSLSMAGAVAGMDASIDGPAGNNRIFVNRPRLVIPFHDGYIYIWFYLDLTERWGQ